MPSRFGSNIPIVGIAVIALTVISCSPAKAQRGGGRDGARSQCQSGDTNKRLVGCTVVINGNGFGSKFDLATAYDARCWAFNDLQQYQRGLADCKAAIALAPRYLYAYQNLGVSLVGLGDLSNAIAAFTKSIELKPNFPFSYLNRGKAFAALGNKELAKRDFEHVISIDPSNQEANERIAALSDHVAPVVRNEPQRQPVPQSDETSSGTGFFVSVSGHVLTNHHVVEGCGRATISRPGYPSNDARIVASDTTNDLALLLTEIKPKAVPALRVGARVGESVFAYGFPLPGLLSSSGNFTVGTITSVAGLGDDSGIMQISTPVQPGNSGGPLLDRSGNVVGVVVAKLNALRLAQFTNDLAQNVNFALKASVVANFLEVNNVQMQIMQIGSNTESLDGTEIAQRAKDFVVQVACMSSSN